jgi:thioesterase domain-containing protein
MSIYVVFFGGFQASKSDMALWLASAQKQRKDVDFDAFPYLGATSDDAGAISGFSKQFAGVIKKIEGSGADPTYIVGHSSGCAIANELDSRLKDHDHIALVALDGFPPDASQMKRSNTQVWSATTPDYDKRKKLGNASLNYEKLLGRIGAPRLQVYKPTGVTTTWALHFYLVNAAATNKIKTTKDLNIGYAACAANLGWLK